MAAAVFRGPDLLATLADMWNVVALLHYLLGRLAGITPVCTQMLDDGSWTTNHPDGERRLKQLHIMPLGTAHD